MRKETVLSTLFFSLLLLACEDPISIDLPSSRSYIVVEGWITDQPGPYRIKLSQTLPFDSRETNPKISGASVSILSRANTYLLTEDANAPGEYLTDSAEFVGVVGMNYRLAIEVNGKTIVSDTEPMRPSPPFDTLTYTFVENIFVPETFSFTSGFLVTGFVTDSSTRNDYYRWKVTENGVSYDRAQDLILITDRFFNGQRFGFEVSGILFQEGDTVSIDQYSIDQSAFEYLRNLNTQAIGLGKSTSTPPSTVRGNLRNLLDDNEVILGYFGVSSVSRGEVIIQNNQ